MVVVGGIGGTAASPPPYSPSILVYVFFNLPGGGDKKSNLKFGNALIIGFTRHCIFENNDKLES